MDERTYDASKTAVILSVDDDPAFGELLRAMLQGEGYHLLFAGNGVEAVALAEQYAPDIILLDAMMPGLDGFEVCRRLRASPAVAEAAILMVTALTDRASRLKGLNAGADDFLSKPLDRQELIARLRTIVRLNRYRRLHEQAARLAQVNALLNTEIAERQRAQEALQTLNAELELQVSERTNALRATVQDLRDQIAERLRVEESLRQMEELLAQRLAEQSRKLAGVYEVMLMASQTATLEEMLRVSLVKIVGILGGEAGCIHQAEEGSDGALRLCTQDGLPAEAQRRLGRLSSDWMTADQIPRAISDLRASAAGPPGLRQLGYGAYLGAPISLRNTTLGVVSVFWTERRAFSVEDLALFGAMAEQIGLIIESDRLRQLGEQAAVLRERQRLARELHDSVTQSLHSLVLSADTAGVLLQQQRYGQLQDFLRRLTESARQALKEMRLLLYELKPADVGASGLLEALRLRLETVERRAGIDARLLVESDAAWPLAWEEDLFHIILEALNNALKHSRATQVLTRLRGAEREPLELTIEDDGDGFDPQARRVGGMGLQTMAERAGRLGGRLEIDAAPGRGTKISLRLRRDVSAEDGHEQDSHPGRG